MSSLVSRRETLVAYSRYHIKGMGVPQRNPLPKFTPIERRDLIAIIRKRIGKVLEG